MADEKYYCKESSLKALAAAIKNGAGIASTTKLAVNQFLVKINAFVIPTNRGSPSYSLSTSKTSQTLSKGKYTGGSVSVTSQSKTATLSASGSTVSPDSGKVLEKVTIPARDVFLAESRSFAPGSTNTFSITGLAFKPVGIIMFCAYTKGITYKQPQLASFYWNNGTVKGTAVSSSVASGAPVTSATVTTTNSSITISNVVATYNGTPFNCTWNKAMWTCFIWG